MPATLDACNARKHAKATRVHSAVDLWPREAPEHDDDALLSRPDMLCELEIRLRGRGCAGAIGAELDRRIALRAEALTRSFEDGFCCDDCVAFMASVRALSVPFITSVARIALSFGDN